MRLIQRLWSMVSAELVVGATRSAQWQPLRTKVLTHYKECQACRGDESLEVHHIVPFQVAPERELVLGNLLVLCRDCHYQLGHLRDWRSWNPTVVEDAGLYRVKRDNRPRVT